MNDLAILDVRLADRNGSWNIGIKNGIISQIAPKEQIINAKTSINSNGKILLPGLIDAHVHTRDPGYGYKEDFRSASLAAANGGITTIMAMPNSNPPGTTKSAIRYAKKVLDGKNIINVHLVGGVCAGVPSWIEPMVHEEVIAVDVYDDIFNYGSRYWINIFKQLKNTNLPICFYLMDSNFELFRKQLTYEQGCSEIDQIIAATDGSTEAISIARIFPIAAYFDVPAVIRMTSTSEGLKMIRLMRKMYPHARVYIEVCVHYLYLTSDDLKRIGGLAHIHPPLRKQQDVDELWVALQDGTVDYIASDHAPHAVHEKSDGLFSNCATGMTGLETMLPLLLDACSKNRIRMIDIQRLCCENPAKIFGLSDRKGKILRGADADLVLVDDKKRWIVDSNKFYTRGSKNPFEGWKITGKPYLTICNGKLKMENGKVFV